MMQSPTVISTSINQKQLNMVSPKQDISKSINSKSKIIVRKINNINASTNDNVVKKVPVLKITINKKYNKICASNININKHTLNVTNNINVHKAEKNQNNNEIKSELKDDIHTAATSSKSMIFNLVPIVFEKPNKIENAMVDIKNICTPKAIYVRKGDLSRDHSRQTAAERIRYLYTKAQRDCDILKIRLKALKERHKQEKEEVHRLQRYLAETYKGITKESFNEILKECTKRKISEEEDEYEELLKKVRKLREDILDPKYSILISNNKLGEINVLHYVKNIIDKAM
ncbi:uncharacterized protein LOC143177080 [Calliopsis andreniformis]|uniref:uncharacterized protein LOC143177080 n=1 Tax=Calliopsis andreniformis TaxID=337506 RepID=UPI003FCDEB08